MFDSLANKERLHKTRLANANANIIESLVSESQELGTVSPRTTVYAQLPQAGPRESSYQYSEETYWNSNQVLASQESHQ